MADGLQQTKQWVLAASVTDCQTGQCDDVSSQEYSAGLYDGALHYHTQNNTILSSNFTHNNASLSNFSDNSTLLSNFSENNTILSNFSLPTDFTNVSNILSTLNFTNYSSNNLSSNFNLTDYSDPNILSNFNLTDYFDPSILSNFNLTSVLRVPNQTSNSDLLPSLGFDDSAKTDIIIYCLMFVVAATGNLTVFITLWRNRHRKSRVNLMIMHLAIADLMVTLINFPLEVGWRLTTQWLAGNSACKLFQFLRAFGLYLSSLVLVCISLDRYFAIVHPLKVNDAQRRGKMMLSFAWCVAAVCSLPQSVVFHVASHPEFENFHQCVTFGFFRSQAEEAAYNVFCLAAMYFLPLIIIIIVYLRILWEISQNSRDSKEALRGGGVRNGRLRLRRSDMSNIERARSRTLRMTVIIVLAFIICWTPYVVIVMWYQFDRASAEQVDKGLQDALFIMAVSNSCVNPLVYGTYTINLRAELNRCFGRRTHNVSLHRMSTAQRSTMTATAQAAGGSHRKTATRSQTSAGRGSIVMVGYRRGEGETRSSPPHPRHPLLPSPPLKMSPLASTPSQNSSRPPVRTSVPPSPTINTSSNSNQDGPRVGSKSVTVEIEMDHLSRNTLYTDSNPDVTAPLISSSRRSSQEEQQDQKGCCERTTA